MGRPPSGDMRLIQGVALVVGVALFVAGLILRNDPVIVIGMAMFGFLALSEHVERLVEWRRKKHES